MATFCREDEEIPQRITLIVLKLKPKSFLLYHDYVLQQSQGCADFSNVLTGRDLLFGELHSIHRETEPEEFSSQ